LQRLVSRNRLGLLSFHSDQDDSLVSEASHDLKRPSECLDVALERRNLAVRAVTAMNQMVSTRMRAFFCTTACLPVGRPQCGQTNVSVETSFWQSGQGASDIARLVPQSAPAGERSTCSVSRADAERLRELQRRYFAELRAIVAASEATEVALVAQFSLLELYAGA
jgi:hypothetical protein